MSIESLLTEDQTLDRAQVYPYQQHLLREESEKIDQLERTFAAQPNVPVSVWIRECLLPGHLATREPHPTFLLNIKSTTPVGEIRNEIEQRHYAKGYYDRSIDGPLQLLFDGQVLLDIQRFCDVYDPEKSSKKWKKPYAGIIWITPFYIERSSMRKIEWGNDHHSTIATNDDDVTTTTTIEWDLPQEWQEDS